MSKATIFQSCQNRNRVSWVLTSIKRTVKVGSIPGLLDSDSDALPAERLGHQTPQLKFSTFNNFERQNQKSQIEMNT